MSNTDKVILLSYPRTGTTAIERVFNEYKYRSVPGYKHVPAELLNLNFWKQENTHAIFPEFFEWVDTTEEEARQPETLRLAFERSLQLDNSLQKYFGWMKDVVDFEQLLGYLDNAPDVKLVVLYRKSIVETVASHIISWQSKQFNLEKGQEKNLRFDNFYDIPDWFILDIFRNIRLWQDHHDKLRDRIHSTIAYEDMSFTQDDLRNIITDFVPIDGVEVPTQRMSTFEEKLSAFGSLDKFIDTIIRPNIIKHGIRVTKDLEIDIRSEEELFDEIFVSGESIKNNLPAKNENNIQNPTYSDWEKFISEYDISCVIVDPMQLDPQRWSAEHHYNQKPNSILASSVVGTGHIRALTEQTDDETYKNVCTRLEEFYAIAGDVLQEEPWSLPVVTLFSGHSTVHPGNKLTTAHQILQRDIKVILCKRKGTDINFDFKIKEIVCEDITTITQLRAIYKGRLSGYFEMNGADYERVHLWSAPDYWETYNTRGWEQGPYVSIRDVFDTSREFPGTPITVKDPCTNEDVVAHIITSVAHTEAFLKKLNVLRKPKSYTELLNEPNFCIAPFTHTNINTLGGVQLCCISDFDDPVASNITEQSFNSVWTGDRYQEIRRQLINGERPNMCKTCYKVDDAGGGSDRAYYNANFHTLHPPADFELDIVNGNTTGKPLWADLRPGRFCNLKCRMCYSSTSSSIAKELTDNPELQELTGDYWEEFDDWIENPNTLGDIKKLVPNMSVLKLAGGEPLYIQGVIKLLQWCVDEGHTNLVIDITTNGTRSKGKVLDLCDKFANIHVNFSIDAVGKICEYIRNGVNWPDIAQTYHQYVNRGWGVLLLTTVQAYNIHFMTKTLDWWYESGMRTRIQFNPVEGPSELSFMILPLEERQRIHAELTERIELYSLTERQKEESRLNFVMSRLLEECPENVDELRSKFIRRTTAYDRVRNESIYNVNPALSQFINNWVKEG